MWEKWDGVGSPYGTGNVFGSGVSNLVINATRLPVSQRSTYNSDRVSSLQR
jgi:hypothetical protein